MSTVTPTFRDLSRDEIEAVLARNHIGRLAYAHRDRVGITALHYVYSNGWIYGRTALGEKLAVVAHNHWVAFEVDEVEGLFDWRSVVVHGAMYILSADSAPAEVHSFAYGIELLRQLVPGTLEGDDPAPFRHVVFRIHLDDVSGREATSKGA